MAEDTVPYARFEEVVAARGKAERALEALQKQFDMLEKTLESKVAELGTQHGASLAEVTKERDELLATLEAERLDYQINSAIMSEGVNSEGVDYLRYKYSQVEKPEDGEKPAFADWFKEFAEANATVVGAFKAKPKEAPKAEEPPAAAPTQYSWQRQPAKPTEEKPPTPPVEPVKPPASDPPTYTPEQLSQMGSRDARAVLERMGLVTPRAGEGA